MHLRREDLEVLEKFGFEKKPIAIAFLYKRPEQLNRLETNSLLCEMIKRAQEGAPFYADRENNTCLPALYLLGLGDVPPVYKSGAYAEGLQIYKARAARRIYQSVPRLEKNTVNYVAFSDLENLSFDPDILLFLTKVRQTEILLRAMSYTTGKTWSSRCTSIFQCAWLLLYPFLSGELNYILTGLSFGMSLAKVFPEGQQLISFPFDIVPSMLKNLGEMPWVTPLFKDDRQEFRKKMRADLGLDATDATSCYLEE